MPTIKPANYWIAVTREPRKTKDYWCFGADARMGDHVFIYRIKEGVTGLEKIVSRPAIGGECDFYGMYTGRTTAIKRFPKTLDIVRMKADIILRDIGAVRRNFQGTTFCISEEQANRILKLAK